MDIIHYKLTQDDMRQKNKNMACYQDQALCGNGSYHAIKAKNGVNCPKCREMIKQGKHRGF